MATTVDLDLSRVRFTKRLTVRSYSSREAEPEETYGNLLTGGSRQEELSKVEFSSMIDGDSVITSKLEASGYQLSNHFENKRQGSRSCSIVLADQHLGRMVSYFSDISITLYRDAAEYPRLIAILRA